MGNTVNGTSSSGAAGTNGASQTTGKNQLGKDDFLKLLVTQLQHQDPLQPTDNQAFIAQLAQFSSLEQLQDVSGKLDSLVLSQSSNNQVNASSLLGKQVLYQTNNVDLDGTQGTSIDLTLADAADSVSVVVTDASGKVVRTLKSGAASAGELSIGFDGHDDGGRLLPAGEYKVTANATKKDGSKVSVVERAWGRVRGIDYSGGSTRLLVGQDQVSLADVIQVDQQ